MSKAYKVLADIQADLFILRGISQNISAMYTALEKGDNEPEELFHEFMPFIGSWMILQTALMQA